MNKVYAVVYNTPYGDYEILRLFSSHTFAENYKKEQEDRFTYHDDEYLIVIEYDVWGEGPYSGSEDHA